ncbi:membrane protein insertion efficiency factor YidD [Mycolicibacterium austroafricanum]|uniref:membrane protein insertion efficiency factor YidD n=1 Tax=Mycolicibacterium austroafricanum TaxID=39687 RepID=UPI001CA35391|nr:membrane protein insertion efficiency factor YidD [Mycolicibacterium austroafricanum]QZT62901.1 membrane protein insertion efficiency factor YidD [Mycolicibacterium austroafricanum]
MTARSRGVRAAVYLIQLYRHTISPLRLPTCRFTPTCSQYAVDAMTEFGLFRGGWLTLVRLLKCGPWHNGGWDPIPDRESHSDGTGEDPCATAVTCDTAEHRDRPVEQGKSQTSVV